MFAAVLALLYASLVVSTRLVVVPVQQETSLQLSATCKPSYRGRFGNASIWLVSDECDATRASASFSLTEEEAVVAVRQADVTKKAASSDWQAYALAQISPASAKDQIVFGANDNAPKHIHTATDALYFKVNSAANTLDTLLPSDAQLYQLPDYELPTLHINQDAGSRLTKHLPVQFKSEIAKSLKSISIKTLEKIVRYLSGEDSKSPIRTRHSFTTGARQAAHWLKHEYEDAGFVCSLDHFQRGYSPNVVCLLPRHKNQCNTSEEVVLVGAHYDSRGSFGQVRSGGADDDASGSAALLSIAKAIEHNRLSFERHVMLVAFAGEEQGLIGSRALAKRMKNEDRDIALMLQMDMLAYRLPSEPMQLGFPPIGSQIAIDLIGNVTNVYVPELQVGQTPACCSDHQSFHDLGYAAVHAFERTGPIVDPMYHRSNDVSDRKGYDFAQLQASTRAIFASLMEVAGSCTAEHE